MKKLKAISIIGICILATGITMGCTKENSKEPIKEEVTVEKGVRYTSEKLGIGFEVPKGWTEYCIIEEVEGGITVKYVDKDDTKTTGTLLMITTKEELKNQMEDVVEKEIKGVKYLIGTPTDIGINLEEIDKEKLSKYEELKGEVNIIIESLK
ncbi:MAG: hypothetical protein ACRC28_17365 [Clostridium sp.]|uniref:hypothetical protein n=1 Tax=Clostridium sp. TaxID=1506 RepID=UPI003F406D6E